MSCSPPSAKQAKLSSPINGLADLDVEEIFKRLPPFERLIASEVCRRWHSISRKAWLDITKIDLTPIPGKHIGAVVNQCTNLQSVAAVNKTFDSNELTCLAKVASLKRVRFICCEFKLNPDKASIEQNIFSVHLGDASWTELTFHDARFIASQVTADARGMRLGTAVMFCVANLPASLTHLQLSGLCLCDAKVFSEARLCLDGLERLENLECFILHWLPPYHRSLPVGYNYASDLVTSALLKPAVYEKLTRLKNLKELCLGHAMWLSDQLLVDLVSGLPNLEVLFLTHVDGRDIAEDLAKLITSNSVLRVLVLSGVFHAVEPAELPVRKRFPHGFGSDPLPLLHVFVGKEASENIRFTQSTWDAAIIHPINQPMPEFLEREDIAPIFKNVWIAENIKKVAKHSGKLWHYDTHDTASSIQHI